MLDLELYKKTFVRVQATIAVVTIVLFLALGRVWTLAATFFLFMQVGSFLGALWGNRLRRKVLRGW